MTALLAEVAAQAPGADVVVLTVPPALVACGAGHALGRALAGQV